MYNSDEIKLPPNFLGGHPFPTGALNIRDEKLASFPRDPEETKRHIAEYYGMISHLDDRLGRVVEALKAKGEYENTIIVFAGDNGLALGQHGLFGKQNCYEPSVRVPLIFAGPGIPENKQTEAPAYLFDIFPTLCDLTGTSLPESVEGSSLIKAIEGDDNVRDSLYFAYDEYQRAVKKDGFKLIEYVFEKKHVKTQLFDLHNDPWEMTDLADNTSYSEMKRKLRAELLRLRDEWNDFSSEWGQKFWSACSF
jgi:arylsulfatase A-like enzyme